MDERRAAPRVAVRPEIEATVNDVPVRVVELSAVGARIEHEQRFPLTTPELCITWKGSTVQLPVRIVRSELIGRSGSGLSYRTGVQFVGGLLLVESVLSAILGDDDPQRAVPPESPAPPAVAQPRPSPPPASPPPVVPPVSPAPQPAPAPAALEDTWTRQVRFLKSDPEDEMPYAQFRRTEEGWKKSYVASPEQPPDGFTIPRDERDFAELQHTFDCADAETRRMMQIALQTKLESEAATKA